MEKKIVNRRQRFESFFVVCTSTSIIFIFETKWKVRLCHRQFFHYYIHPGNYINLTSSKLNAVFSLSLSLFATWSKDKLLFRIWNRKKKREIIIVIIMIIIIIDYYKNSLFNTHKKDLCTVLHFKWIKFVP